MQHLAFVLQSLGDKPACIHVPEVILLHAGHLFCLEPLPCYYFMCSICWVKLPTAAWLLQRLHIFWVLLCLHVPLSRTGSSKVHLCVKMVGPGKNLATTSVALYITYMENESSSVEHALLANRILHPIYLLLLSFKTTWLCQMHS